MSGELPHGWIWSTIGEVCHNPQYGWTTKSSKTGSLRVVRTTDITSGVINWDTVPYCEKEPADKEKYLLEDGDIVISRAGTVGYSLLIKSPQHSVFASYLIRFVPLIDENFVAYFLKSPYYWNSISESKIGIAVPNVNATKLKQVSIPIAPLNEQHRIVAKIEELFTRLDAGMETLKQLQAQLKRYRQSVLKAAIEGRLTAEWREQHKEELEPADKLLKRIQEERKKKPGKTHKAPSPVDTSDLPELPERWIWVKLGQITHLITKGSSPKWQGFDYVDKGIMFIRSQNVLWGRLDISNVAFLPESFNKKEKKSILKNGDVLLNIVGASIGRTAIVTDEVENANINQAVSIIRLAGRGLINKFLLYYFLSVNAQSTIHNETVDVARANLSLNDISELFIPFPSIEEQNIIIGEIDRLFSIIDESEQVIESELKRAQSLRQSTLKRAFEGKLVPQDPNDEPASALLERIKAEKAKPKKCKQLEML